METRLHSKRLFHDAVTAVVPVSFVVCVGAVGVLEQVHHLPGKVGPDQHAGSGLI